MSHRLDQGRQAELEPVRMKSCREKLESMGFDVEVHGNDLLVFEYQGNQIRLFPYSGWFTGKGVIDGRGFAKLLKQLEAQ